MLNLVKRVTYLFFLIFMTISCVSDVSGPGGAKVVEKNGKFFIEDNTGKLWDVTHAKNKYGMEPSEFQFGLGPNAIRPILNPRMISPGEPNYPDDSATFLVLATDLHNDPRAYPIEIMSIHEVADEKFADTHVAVAY